MRKRFGILLGILMLASVPAYAGEIDISALEVDQLIQLKEQIMVALNEKGYDGLGLIGAGTYKVGTDIKEGTFTFINTRPEEEWSGLYTFDSEERYDEEDGSIYNADTKSELFHPNDIATVVLHDGMVLKVVGQGILEESTPSWAP